STRWAERRSGMDSAVLPIDGSSRHRSAWRSIPEGTERVVIDAPAGAQADALGVYLEHADALVVPVVPAALVVDAAVPCLNTLARHPRIRGGALRVGLVGNRLRPWTNASQQAMDLLRQWPY